MQFKSLLTIALLCGITLAQTANAKDSGLYVGAGVGAAAVQIDDVTVGTYDETEAAWKIFGGYTLGSWLGVEAGYVDLASSSADVGGQNVKVDLSGFDAFAVAGLPIGPVRVFAKVGGIYWDSDVKIAGNTIDLPGGNDGTDFAGGIGLEFSLFSLAMRAEVEYFDIVDGAALASIGATFTF